MNGTDVGPQLGFRFGRNELCPYGSGKKYKRSCGGATVNRASCCWLLGDAEWEEWLDTYNLSKI
jgi:hypothetical protein